MLQRLATVIHWLCLLAAVGWGVLLYNTFTPEKLSDHGWIAIVVGSGVLSAVGWVIDFVLTGRTTFIPTDE